MFIPQKLMLEVDSDESGTIDFPEFLSLMSKVVLYYYDLTKCPFFSSLVTPVQRIK